MKFRPEMLLLYAVTDRGDAPAQNLFDQVEAALRGGVTMVQLREKSLPDRAFLEEAKQILALCRRYRVPMLINDRVDLALACGADGVHVGLQDEPVAEIRKRVGGDFIIGATAKTVEQAKAAERAGADYLGVGAVFPSPTKRDAVRITLPRLREICEAVSIPAVAIGGISETNVMQLHGGGMRGIAVVSALFRAADVEQAAATLKKLAEAVTGP